MQLAPFQLEPDIDFRKGDAAQRYAAAIAAVRSRLGMDHDLVIGGERVKTRERFASFNPSHRDEVVGRYAKAEVTDVERALEAAWTAFPAWSRAHPERRAELLVQTAKVIRRDKLEFAAWLTLEVGKPRAEAIADVHEAIDFCEFYAREMLRLASPPPLVRIPGEENALRYLPLGAGAVIPPWNFPLAILCGMTTAAVVAGNTVVLKPSSDSPGIALEFVEALEEAGMPPGVVNLVTGPGAAIGDRLVEHPRTRFVAFTGSKEVGLRINERASRPSPGQVWIKRVVCEMGGKNAVIVDRDADLDAAVGGVVASAFGYSGQKCSACSRAIVDEAVYEPFLARLKDAVAALRVGPAEDPETVVGPVINARAQDKVLRYVEVGREEGRALVGGERGDASGFYVRPAVFVDVAPRARLAQEEIFGPVLAVIQARDFDHALAIANDTEYGLTGSVYTADRDKIERAKREFFVGNLYVNRKCTGALVGVHPFGGFHMSGTDSKAGGQDYLGLFLQAQAVTEKVK